MKKITDRMLRGGGVTEDPDTLKSIGDNIAGRTICAFGEACAWPTQSFVQKFPEEFAARAQKASRRRYRRNIRRRSSSKRSRFPQFLWPMIRAGKKRERRARFKSDTLVKR